MANGTQRILCEISNTAFGAVGRLLERDQEQAIALRSATTGSRQIISEETITETMAIDIQAKHSDHVKLELFTHHEERLTGADWYWQVRTAQGAVHARVQAKRIRRKHFGQADDEGTIELNWPQINTLIERTLLDHQQFPRLESWVAIYARLSASPPCGEPPSQCRLHDCEGACSGWGEPSIWIGRAEELRDSLDSGCSLYAFRELIPHVLRLDCLLPCIRRRGVGGGEGPSYKGFEFAEQVPNFEDCIAAINTGMQATDSYRGALLIYE